MQVDISVTDLNEEHKHQQEFRWASQLVATQGIYINRHLHRSDELLKLQCQISISIGVFITMTGGPLQEYIGLQMPFGWTIYWQPISHVLSDFLNEWCISKEFVIKQPTDKSFHKVLISWRDCLGLIAFLHAHNFGFILNSQLWFQIMAVT